MEQVAKQRIEREIWLTYLNRSLKDAGLISRVDYDRIRRRIEREYGNGE